MGGYGEMLTFADEVGGVQKDQKHADVCNIYGWSLTMYLNYLKVST